MIPEDMTGNKTFLDPTTPDALSGLKQHQDEVLLTANTRLQQFVTRYVTVSSLMIFGVMLWFQPIWQNALLSAGLVLMLLGWHYAYYLTRHAQLQASALLFTWSAVAFEALTLFLIDGNNGSALVGCLCALIYASLFSRRHVLYLTVFIIIAYLLSHLTHATALFSQVVLTGWTALLFDGLFALLLLPVAAYLLHWSVSTRQALQTGIEHFSRHQLDIIQAARNVTDTLNDVTETLNAFALRFSERSSEQAAAVSEVGYSMTRINELSNANASAATAIHKISETMQQKAISAKMRLQDVRFAFNRVIGANEDARTSFSHLAAQAQNTDDVLRMNRDIAMQIKILAVNAGIQAAKAGSFGAGFKVVAQELKTMIAETEKSLEDSALLLESIRENARNSARMLETSSTLLERHYDDLETTGTLVDDMTDDMSTTSEQFETIAGSSIAQLSGLTQIREGIDQIDVAARNLNTDAHVVKESLKRILDAHAELFAVLQRSDAEILSASESA